MGIKNETIKLGAVLSYEQPSKYIVESTDYNNTFKTPVLTAGKSFLLGYTNEIEGIFSNPLPVIIFDDFTTAIKFVDFPFKVKSSAMKILIADNKKADIKYLFYKMQTIKINADEHKRYWISNYSQIEIPLPPLDQQKKIASILDAADEYRQKTKALIAKYDELAQSLFIEMFGEHTGIKYLFKDISDKSQKGTFSNGPFGSDLLTSELASTGVPVIYIRDIASGSYIRKSKVCVTHAKADSLENCQVKPNDVLITKVGTPPGTAAIYPKDSSNGIITQDVIRVRVNQKLVVPEFIQYWFNSSLGAKALASIIVEGTRMRFGLGDLKKTSIIVPTIELQNQFAERVQSIEAQKAQAQQSLDKAEELFNSLLQKAFNGDLK